MTDTVSTETDNGLGESVAVFSNQHDPKLQFDLVLHDDGTIELWSSTVDTEDGRYACLAQMNPTLGADGTLAMLLILQESPLTMARTDLAERCGLNVISPEFVLPDSVGA